MRNDFAVFILTHGRAGNVLTYHSLRKCGYTGPIFLLVDNEDKQLAQYQETFGSQVVVCDKKQAALITDTCDNLPQRNSVVFARNWNFIVAKQMGIKYFWQLDDDYTRWAWTTDTQGNYTTKAADTTRLDDILQALLQFFIDSQARSVAIVQGGDLLGGSESTFIQMVKRGTFSRKAMNSFIFDSDKPCEFRGRVNDDVNLYVECGRRGELFITVPRVRLYQPQTQLVPGGCTEIYKETGTYVKSFYSIIVAPSCVKLIRMGNLHKRIHHAVQWKYAAPLIVDEKHRKQPTTK